MTCPPTAIVVAVGSKKKSPTVTLADAGGGPAASPAAVKVTGDPIAPELEAWSVLVPAAGPSVHVVEASPSAPVVLDDGLTEPPPDCTDQLTDAPASAAPSRATRTTTGLADYSDPDLVILKGKPAATRSDSNAMHFGFVA